MTDPYASYLRQADELFAQGDIMKAGQIWQAILKQDTSHAQARAGLIKVKEILTAQKALAEAAAAAPPPAPPVAPVVEAPAPAAEVPAPLPVVTEAPAPPTVSPEEIERLLREGCTLYDMGQTEDALRKWEKLLSLAPDHAMARDYANGARRELGLAPLAAGEAPTVAPEVAPVAATQAAAHDHGEDIDKLLREAVQLYDMGLPEEAVAKWEKALQFEPHRQDIQGYIAQAQSEISRHAAAPTKPTAAPSTPTQPMASANAAQVDVKVRQGEHLLSLQRFDEALFTFKQALALDPNHSRAMEGVRHAQARHNPAPAQAPTPEPASSPSYGLPVGIEIERPTKVEMAPEPEPDSEPLEEAPAAQPPSSLTRTLPPQREGLKVPSGLNQAKAALDQYPFLKDPKVIGGVVGGLVLFFATCSFVQGKRADSRRQDAVKSVSDSALAEVAQDAQAADLNERPEAVRAEAKEAMGAEPLLAYLRAEYLVKIAPGDGAAAQLLEKAKADLPGGISGASLAEAQRHLQEHNLEAASKVFDALLRAEPGNAELRLRAARVQLSLAAAYAGQEKWDEAKSHLLQARAMQPGDRAWALKLRILELAQGMPRGPQRDSWLSFLG